MACQNLNLRDEASVRILPSIGGGGGGGGADKIECPILLRSFVKTLVFPVENFEKEASCWTFDRFFL